MNLCFSISIVSRISHGILYVGAYT